MVTLVRMGGSQVAKNAEFYGKSGDVKPVNSGGIVSVPNASTFYEMNTGKIFLFDEDENTWIDQSFQK